jgi:UDP-MurNAc hydroxylase
MKSGLPSLSLINHACVLIETDDAIVLSDPWMEGTAFHDGWALLDSSTSNVGLIEQLRAAVKRIVVWYSHEHSDHFSMSFLRALKQAALPDVRIVYQHTPDGRVAAFLRGQGWDVLAAKQGRPIEIAPGLSITVAPFFDSGDSYALVRAGSHSVLNLNDCVVDTPAKAQHVMTSLGISAGEVTVLLTQFGYANWIGNEDQAALRIEAAEEKTRRIALQAMVIRPTVIIPFASFSYFCHADNAYLNDAQNTVDGLMAAAAMQAHLALLCPLALGDEVPLAAFAAPARWRAHAERGITHWRPRRAPAEPTVDRVAPVGVETLALVADKYRAAISRTFGGMNRLLERAGLLKPVTFDLVDLGRRYSISYAHGLRASTGPAEISCSSDVLHFVLSNDFGFNTMMVNGRFRAEAAGYRRAWRFFVLQDLKKMGFGVGSPLTTALLAMRNVRKFVRRRIG